jgi:hypothetical protein
MAEQAFVHQTIVIFCVGLVQLSLRMQLYAKLEIGGR